MDTLLNKALTTEYHSTSQIARVVTEDWMTRNMFCPHCGQSYVTHLPNNSPVGDFICQECHNEYELKSKRGGFSKKINDGAYETMISRITSNNNPDFFLLDYSLTTWQVNNLIFIPKYFFVPEIIEKRKPLAQTARRAGWVGCNIILDAIPEQGRVPIIINGKIQAMSTVLSKTAQSRNLETRDLKKRGWLLDVLNCVNMIKSQEFSLKEIYYFTELLARKHPDNHNIQPKIRQQLQYLRDKGFIEFISSGKYRKV